MNHLFYRGAALFEEISARFQGKGFSGSTIRSEVSLIRRLMKSPPRTIIDVGGNVGDWSYEARSQFPNATIHIVEPANVNVGRLRDRFKNDSLIQIHKLALSDRIGRAPLFSNEPGSGLASLLQRNLSHFGINHDEVEVVNTDTISEFAARNLRTPVDLVKLDVEGHELAILKGAPADFWAEVRGVQFEFGGANIDSRTSFRDFWQFFETNNFILNRLTPFGHQTVFKYSEQDETFRLTNYLAVRHD